MATTKGAVAVHGLADLHRAFAKADKDRRKALRDVERDVAEPVRSTAEGMAITRIRGIARTANPKWHGMRIGITRSLVYVAPKQRGRLTRKDPARYRRGTRFADLLMDLAMDPALEQHRGSFEFRMARAFDQLADEFNRGGIPNA